MKNYIFLISMCIILIATSCERDFSRVTYTASDLAVTIPAFDSKSATVAVFAKNVKSLDNFTIGVCYSKSPEPTTEDTHVEKVVDPDTLLLDNLTMNFKLPDLEKATNYYVKAYIDTPTETYYSGQKEFKTYINTLEINVSDDYIPEDNDYWVTLSDNNTILVTQKIENGKSYFLSENVPEIADLHFFRFYRYNDRNYVNITSYADIVPDILKLDMISPTPLTGKATVTISDLANIRRWGIASTKYSVSTTSSANKSLSTSLSQNPDRLFMYFLPSDGSAPRYKYSTNVLPSSTLSYLMTDLTAMTNYSEVILPANDYYYVYLGGYNESYYTDYINYYGDVFYSGYPGTFRLYYPVSIAANYYLYAFYAYGEKRSTYVKTGTSPTLSFPSFPAISTGNTTGFKTATSTISNYSDFELMNFSGSYNGSTTTVSWTYYKQPQASNSIAPPEILPEIEERTGDLPVSSFSFASVSYYDFINSQISGYESYVNILVKQIVLFYDVVKEYRIYTLSPGSKSAGNAPELTHPDNF